MRKARLITAAALLAAVLAGCERGGGSAQEGRRAERTAVPGDSGVPPGQLPPGVSGEQANLGRRLYRSNCVMCHGEGGVGTQLGPSLVDTEWSRGTGSFEEIIQTVAEGAPATDQFGVPMPPRGDGAFTDEQVRAVSAYAWSLARRTPQ